MERVLRLPEVLERIGMKRAWLYCAVRQHSFPPGFKLGARARGWTASSVEQWLAERVREFGGPGAVDTQSPHKENP